MWIRKTTFPNQAIYHLVAAAVFGEGGLKSDAERESAWLKDNAPALVKNMRQELSKRLARSQDVEFFIGSLRKAGLDIEELRGNSASSIQLFTFHILLKYDDMVP